MHSAVPSKTPPRPRQSTNGERPCTDRPYRPRVLITPWRVSIAIQSPDQDHPLIEVDGHNEYRITGTRGTVSYASFLSLASRIPDNVGAAPLAIPAESILSEFDPTAYQPTGFLTIHDLEVNADGTFEIVLSTSWVGVRGRLSPLWRASCYSTLAGPAKRNLLGHVIPGSTLKLHHVRQRGSARVTAAVIIACQTAIFAMGVRCSSARFRSACEADSGNQRGAQYCWPPR
jgi:hypothetical protein